MRGDRVERVAVRVGAERAGEVEVLAGINAGDVVVASARAELTEGAAVEAGPLSVDSGPARSTSEEDKRNER